MIKPKYIDHNNFAVCLTLGVSLSATGPAISALNNCTPPKPRSGNIAMLNTIIPIPPINWVKLLQNSTPFGVFSIFDKTLAPVVVSPDMASKNESV